MLFDRILLNKQHANMSMRSLCPKSRELVEEMEAVHGAWQVAARLLLRCRERRHLLPRSSGLEEGWGKDFDLPGIVIAGFCVSVHFPGKGVPSGEFSVHSEPQGVTSTRGPLRGGLRRLGVALHRMSASLRYFLRATISRRLNDVVKEMDIVVHTLSTYPELNSSIKMEVGIEDCLHIEFEYNKSK